MMAAGVWFLVLLFNGVPMATGPYDRTTCKVLSDAVPREADKPDRAVAWCVHSSRFDNVREEQDYGWLA